MHDEGLLALPQLLEAAGIRDCILVGHSDGASIALVYAGGTPAKPLRGVISEAAHVFCEDVTVRAIQDAGDAYRHAGLRRRLEKYHGENTDCAFWGWHDAWLDPEFREWNLQEYLTGIGVPLLAIQGEDDQYGTAAQIDAIRRGVPHAQTLMLPDCGHAPHVEQADATLAAMTEFVASLLV
jgi:pimeloyl-ACP methyl ester carboxylesterase